MKPNPIPISKTDVQRIILYLDAAEKRYDATGRQCDISRAWAIRQTIKKLNNKLIKHQNND